MKKTIFLLAAIGSLTACGNKGDKNATDNKTTASTSTTTPANTDKPKEEEKKPEPPKEVELPKLEAGQLFVDFPVVETLKAAVGDKVIAVSADNLKLHHRKFVENDPSGNQIYLQAGGFTIVELGAKESKVKSEYGQPELIPNAVIAVIPKTYKAKVGDKVAVFLDASKGVRIALITDISDPANPKAHILDMSSFTVTKGEDKKPTGATQEPKALKAGDLLPVSKPFDPGTYCLVKEGDRYDILQVLRVEGERVVGIKHTLVAFNKSECSPIPVSPKLKVGDAVWAAGSGVSNAYSGKVTFIDAKNGYCLIQFDSKWNMGVDPRPVPMGQIALMSSVK